MSVFGSKQPLDIFANVSSMGEDLLFAISFSLYRWKLPPVGTRDPYNRAPQSTPFALSDSQGFMISKDRREVMGEKLEC